VTIDAMREKAMTGVEQANKVLNDLEARRDGGSFENGSNRR
jgi:hypothetical protein